MRLTIFLATILMLNGCGMFRRAKAPPPPGPTPVRIPDQVTSLDPAPAPKNLPAPPPIGGTAANAKPAPTNALGLPETPTAGPPPTVDAVKPPVKRAAAPPAAAAPATVEAPVQEAPAYRLGELRTPEEKEKLRRQAEQLIGECAAALTVVEGRNLTATQSEMVSRVRTFAQQARETIDKDPGEARSFAAKGRTFAEALLAELR